jgi:ribosomal protein L11 methyltransferase
VTSAAPDPSNASPAWIELAVECDREAVEPVSELFARHGYNQGVVVEEPFTQDQDGDNLAIDPTRPVTVRTFLAEADAAPETIDAIRQALWHLGRMRHVGELQTTRRREEDWANAWKAHFSVHRVGRRVTVRAPWHDYEPQPGEVVVALDPGMAFGTGLHPSTRLTLRALEAALRPGDTVLDVGAGSGILGIAAALLGAARVDGVDVEPVAIRAARDNAARNGVADRARFEVGSVGPDAPFAGEYDLVLANIIARILIELSSHLAAATRPGGALVLAGIIESREAEVAAAFDALGLTRASREQSEDWVCLVYRKT